ncbi:hypothetical protein AM588_10008020 [Phytophthora nicotianae]|uniref:Uncharacterized protein n=1 Tax=Phytophthora nicotianae TaxID=4792 RepID=A0A0W8DEV1_PHYNI|nr:hypothetical protein AM588_10008020 [Phytophthora nicotianae]
MSSSLTQAPSTRFKEQEGDEELSAWDVNSAVDYTAQELERIDFIWGRIRSDRGAASPTIKADIRVEQYCVLNQILEFHGIVQSQVGRLTAIKEFLNVQRHDLLNDQPNNDDVEVVFRGQKVEIVEYARISVPIPQLEEMLVHLDEQIAWLVHVRDNVKALLDCQDLYYDYY